MIFNKHFKTFNFYFSESTFRYPVDNDFGCLRSLSNIVRHIMNDQVRSLFLFDCFYNIKNIKVKNIRLPLHIYFSPGNFR